MKTLIIATLLAAMSAPTKTEALQAEAALDALCPLLEQEDSIKEAIAAERANPAGIVDLRVLHELGESLAFTRTQIKEVRAENAAGLKVAKRIIHKNPDLGFCISYDAKRDEKPTD
jgi:hypothetical protein